MQIPLLMGRVFTEADRRDRLKVAIIDEQLAREYWLDESPLGKRIHFGQPENPQPGAWHTIVGVVGSVQHEGLGTTPKNVYVPNLQEQVGQQTLAIRSILLPEILLASVKTAVREMDANLPITQVATMREVIAQAIWQPCLYSILFAAFAVVALLLACVGIYGVMSYAVAARTNELGIRMALGAQPHEVLRLVIGQGASLALSGVGLGLLGAWLLTRLMKTLLFGISATDPLTFGSVALLLTVAALSACWIPARRATKVDPLIALRCE